MRRTAVILAVGLTRGLLRHMPRLSRWAERRALVTLKPTLPAVTCSVQASLLTGRCVREHGIVANGWYDRERAEVQFWKQSNHLVKGEKVWDVARRRDAGFTCTNLFWWFNMYSSVDAAVTPRPIYRADGRKVSDLYTAPAAWRNELQEQLGRFPLQSFWGPLAGSGSTRWIADAALILDLKAPATLTLVYLPHLDYDLQRFGPDSPAAIRAAEELDVEVGRLIAGLEAGGADVLVLSEYGIEPVDTAVPMNRVLRSAGMVEVRVECGGEILDAGASRAFAVADHQVAHVYIRDAADVPRVADICRSTPGVAEVLDRAAQQRCEIDHPRGGELVLVAARRHWFSYSYWLDDARAPDFARTVDIHRKPGYDPCELFFDPAMWPRSLRLGWKWLRNRLGMRTLFDIVPLDAALVRGSHGRPPDAEYAPLMIATESITDGATTLDCRTFPQVVLRTVFGESV